MKIKIMPFGYIFIIVLLISFSFGFRFNSSTYQFNKKMAFFSIESDSLFGESKVPFLYLYKIKSESFTSQSIIKITYDYSLNKKTGNLIVILSDNSTTNDLTNITEDNVTLVINSPNKDFAISLTVKNLSKNLNKSLILTKIKLNKSATTYFINNSINFTKAKARFSYDDYGLVNEYSLKFLKCHSWDNLHLKCLTNWTDLINQAYHNLSGNYFEVVTYSFSSFQIKENLFCGDGVCYNEDCNSCSKDCGECPLNTTKQGITLKRTKKIEYFPDKISNTSSQKSLIYRFKYNKSQIQEILSLTKKTKKCISLQRFAGKIITLKFNVSCMENISALIIIDGFFKNPHSSLYNLSKGIILLREEQGSVIIRYKNVSLQKYIFFVENPKKGEINYKGNLPLESFIKPSYFAIPIFNKDKFPLEKKEIIKTGNQNNEKIEKISGNLKKINKSVVKEKIKTEYKKQDKLIAFFLFGSAVVLLLIFMGIIIYNKLRKKLSEIIKKEIIKDIKQVILLIKLGNREEAFVKWAKLSMNSKRLYSKLPKRYDERDKKILNFLKKLEDYFAKF